MRPQRPNRNGNGNVDLIANLEGNRALQSSKSFVTQGVILPVNIDKSSLSIIKEDIILAKSWLEVFSNVNHVRVKK